jgi:parallel beta helix pectate lyase-like protein
MKRLISAVLLIGASLAQAQTAQRTFVSAGSGNDANPCSRALPCRQFAAAIARTSPGGEVIVLDSGGYGIVTINQAISLISPSGVYAGITAFSGDAITVNTGVLDTVVLRGLSLNGLGGTNGVHYTAGFVLHVENLVVSRFDERGILFGGSGELFVKDTTVRNNFGAGILLDAISGVARGSMDRCRLERNDSGLVVTNNSRVTIRDSVAALNAQAGMSVQIGPETSAHLTVENCIASYNANGFSATGAPLSGAILTVSNSSAIANTSAGILASVNSTVRASRNTVTKNGTGLHQIPNGLLESAGNNTVRGNGSETSGTITPFSPM